MRPLDRPLRPDPPSRRRSAPARSLPGVGAIRRHVARRSRGQSLVEFALLLPVFLLFFATTLDLGRLALAQLAVSNAAKEGAFQASRTPADFDSTKGCPADGTSNLVVCRVMLELKNSGISVSPADIALTCSVNGCPTGMGNQVKVSVVGHFTLLTPILAPFFGGSQDITFTRSSTTQIETLPTPAIAAATPTPTPTPTPTASASASATASASPTPAPTTCTVPSAGFTHSTSPKNDKAPVTLTVVDTTTSPSCAITSWLWTWGDNTTSLIKDPGPHVYLAKGTYNVTLTVTNAAGSNTTGAVQVTVK